MRMAMSSHFRSPTTRVVGGKYDSLDSKERRAVVGETLSIDIAIKKIRRVCFTANCGTI
jgi:hypothetical protein